MHKRERYAKLFGTILCEMFAILTIIYLLADGEADRLALAFGTLLLALLPMLLEKPGHDQPRHIVRAHADDQRQDRRIQSPHKPGKDPRHKSDSRAQMLLHDTPSHS